MSLQAPSFASNSLNVSEGACEMGLRSDALDRGAQKTRHGTKTPLGALTPSDALRQGEAQAGQSAVAARFDTMNVPKDRIAGDGRDDE